VAEVAAAGGATNLGANHSVRAIFNQLDGIASLWLVKTWPTAVRIKLGCALEQLRAATAAREGSDSGFFEQLAGTGALGSTFAKNVIFKLAKFSAPFVVTLVY
jgi:hypothetical protein